LYVFYKSVKIIGYSGTLILLLVILNTLQSHAWTLTLCEGQNYGGPCHLFSGNTGKCTNLTPELYRRVSSFKWDQSSICCVTFFSNNANIGYRCGSSSSPKMINDNAMSHFCVDRCFI
jgi:hypothetical protein